MEKRVYRSRHIRVTRWANKAGIWAVSLLYFANKDASARIQLLRIPDKECSSKEQKELVAWFEHSWEKPEAGLELQSTVTAATLERAERYLLWDASDRIDLWTSLRYEKQQNPAITTARTIISSWEASQTPHNKKDKQAIRELLEKIEEDLEKGTMAEDIIQIDWPAIYQQQWDAQIYIPRERMQRLIKQTGTGKTPTK